jgi:hypothetical protein
MTIPVEKIADLRLKYLEMIQAIIARIANYNATLKNYCITLTTATCGFAITLNSPRVIILALLPIAVFALLDAQYLRIERRFRALYDRVRQEDWHTVPNFEINIAGAPLLKFFTVFFSWSIWSFYLPLAVGVISVFITMEVIGGRTL